MGKNFLFGYLHIEKSLIYTVQKFTIENTRFFNSRRWGKAAPPQAILACSKPATKPKDTKNQPNGKEGS